MNMTSIIRAVCLSVLCLSLFGCFAGGQAYQTVAAPANYAQVYVYREKAFFGALKSMAVLVDDQQRGDLRGGGYVVYHLRPGPHEIALKSWGTKVPYKLVAQAGHTYYLRFDVVDTGVTQNVMPAPGVVIPQKVGQGVLTLVNPSVAEQQLQSLRLSE